MFRFNSVVLLKHIIHDLLCLHPVSSQVLRGSQGIYGDHHFHHIAKGGVQHASLSHASRLEATGSEVTQKTQVQVAIASFLMATASSFLGNLWIWTDLEKTVRNWNSHLWKSTSAGYIKLNAEIAQPFLQWPDLQRHAKCWNGTCTKRLYVSAALLGNYTDKHIKSKNVPMIIYVQLYNVHMYI